MTEVKDIHKAFYWQVVEAKRNRYLERMRIYFRSILNKQFRELAQKIDATNYSSDTILETMTKEPIEKAFKYLYLTVGVDFAQSSFNGIKSQYGWLIKEEDPIDEWYESLLHYVNTKAGKKITSIAEQTRKLALGIIRTTLEETLNEGMGADATARAIRKNLVKQGIELNQWRALRIARTEVMTASNLGTMEGARSSNQPMDKYWIATYDNRTRDTHMGVESQNPIDINDKFQVGAYQMDMPGDSSAGPEEVINCRCTVAFKVKDI